MEEMIPCSVKDQEVFRRVWQRVMEGRDQSCSPIQPGIPGGWEGDLPCDCLKALIREQGEGTPLECEHEGAADRPMESQPPEEPECPSKEPACPAEEQPAPPMEAEAGSEAAEEPPMEAEPSIQNAQSGWQSAEEAPAPEPPCPDSAPEEGLSPENGPDRGNDLPQLWDESQPNDDRTARLRRHVMDTLEGWQFYRHLAKRTRGTDARTLNSMATDQHKEARRLAAAYFLLTGLRYWPTELLGTPAIPSYWGALRTRHQAEQRQENAYRLASDDWEDPDLLALYAALIEGCQRRSQQLRGLLEQG